MYIIINVNWFIRLILDVAMLEKLLHNETDIFVIGCIETHCQNCCNKFINPGMLKL